MPTNSIAIQRRTERLDPPATTVGDVAGWVATAILTILIVGFRPFHLHSEAVGEGGDIVNQLGFGMLGSVTLLALLSFVDRRMLAAILSPSWLILLLLVFLSVLNAELPSDAMRGFAFTMIAFTAAIAVVVLPRDGDHFARMLLVAGTIVLVLCYAGIVVYPEAAIHGGDGVEPQHDGFWRGSFTHKNIAGPVMAIFAFAGLYLFRRGDRVAGCLLFLGAVVFMANTGSKTTVGLVPLVIMMVALPPIIGMRLLTVVIAVSALIGTALATLGIVFIDPIRDLAAHFFPGLTYTGRTSLWQFMGEMIALKPWAGYGYQSFWGTGVVLTADQPFDRDWDIRGIVHGHNGYLDLAVTAGLPALAVGVVAFVVSPLRDYMRVPLLRENVYRADFFMMVLLFALLNAFLETFFFRRADPVWLFLVMAVFGLRFAARFPLREHQPS